MQFVVCTSFLYKTKFMQIVFEAANEKRIYKLKSKNSVNRQTMKKRNCQTYTP